MADTEALRLLLLQQLQASSGTPRSPATNAAAAAQVQLDNNFINSSDFRIFCFKILPCTRRYGHDWTACPFCHPGEKATRRCPQKHSYMPLACPDIKKTGECPRRDACTYAHNVFEFWCHPLRFRTQLCSYGADCKRSICFFAHSYSELRVVDQSLLQELERQMDLLGEGAGFGFPPASKRSARDERYGPLAPGDVFALPSATGQGNGNTPRRSGEDATMSLTSQSSGRITTAMSEARAVADRAMPTGLLPDASTPQMGDHHSSTSSPFVSVEGMTVDSVSGENGLQSSGGGSASNGPGSGAGGPGADTGPSSCGALGGMEPSMAALQMLQMQAAAQQRQQQQHNQQRVGGGAYNHEKIQAAAALLGLDASYLGQVLQAAPPPPPPVPVANGVQAAMQNLMQQLLAANGGGGSVPASPAANPPSLGGWVGERGAAEVAQSRAMAMLMGMAEGGGGAGNGSLRVPIEPIHAVPSLRANEEQMASTIKVLMELNAGSRGMGTPTVPTPRGGNGGGGGGTTMHAAMQQLQELGSMRPQLVQQLQELGSLAVANGSGASNGNSSMHSVVQQLQEQLGSLRAPLPEPEPAGGLAAALASMQHSIDTARLQQALGSITQHNNGGNIGDNNGSNANAALVSALLSQLSGNHGGNNNSPHRPHQQQHHPQQQQQLQQQLSGGVNLSDMGLSAFNGASAAAIAAAAAAQAAGTSLTVAPQPQDRHAYANAAHHALNASNSNHHQFNVPQGHNGATNQHHANGAGAGTGASNAHGGAKGASSPSPVDVLSMRSQRSGPPGSGSDSLAGSDGSGSPPPSNANANTRTVEMSESVEEEDLAAHPELLGAHRLLGTLSELVGGGGAGTNGNGCAGSPMAVPSNSAAAAAAASNHPLRGSPSLRPGAVSFSPPGNNLLGASMSTPLLGLENLRLNGSFTATGQQRPSFESRMFGGLGMGAVGSTGGFNGGAGGLNNLAEEGAGMGLGMSLGGLDLGGGVSSAAAGLNLGGVAVSGGSGTGLGVIGGGASPKGGLGSGLGLIGGGTSPKGGVGSGYGPVGGAVSPKGGPSAGGVAAALEEVAARVAGEAESPKAKGSWGSDGAGAASAVQEKLPQQQQREQEEAAPIRPQASGAVALLTPAGTGSFSAHDFPNEL